MTYIDFYKQFTSELSDENKIALANYVLSGEYSDYIENTDNLEHSSLIYPKDNYILFDNLQDLGAKCSVAFTDSDIAYRWKYHAIVPLSSRQVISHVAGFLLMNSNINDLEEDYDGFMKVIADTLATIKPNVMPFKELS